MDADLVRAPGARPEFEPGLPVGRAEHAIIGDRLLPIRVHHHAPADYAARLFRERRLDASLALTRHARYDCPIHFLDPPLGEQPPQPPERLRVPAEHQTARR